MPLFGIPHSQNRQWGWQSDRLIITVRTRTKQSPEQGMEIKTGGEESEDRSKTGGQQLAYLTHISGLWMQDETGVAPLLYDCACTFYLYSLLSCESIYGLFRVWESETGKGMTRKKHRNRIYDNTSLAKPSTENDWKTVSERKRQNLKRNGVNQKYVIKQSVKSLYSGTVRPLLFFSRSYLYILRIGEGTRERGRKIREKSKVKQNQHCQIFSLWSINEDGNQRKRRQGGRARITAMKW